MSLHWHFDKRHQGAFPENGQNGVHFGYGGSGLNTFYGIRGGGHCRNVVVKEAEGIICGWIKESDMYRKRGLVECLLLGRWGLLHRGVFCQAYNSQAFYIVTWYIDSWLKHKEQRGSDWPPVARMQTLWLSPLLLWSSLVECCRAQKPNSGAFWTSRAITKSAIPQQCGTSSKSRQQHGGANIMHPTQGWSTIRLPYCKQKRIHTIPQQHEHEGQIKYALENCELLSSVELYSSSVVIVVVVVVVVVVVLFSVLMIVHLDITVGYFCTLYNDLKLYHFIIISIKQHHHSRRRIVPYHTLVILILNTLLWYVRHFTWAIGLFVAVAKIWPVFCPVSGLQTLLVLLGQCYMSVIIMTPDAHFVY